MLAGRRQRAAADLLQLGGQVEYALLPRASSASVAAAAAARPAVRRRQEVEPRRLDQLRLRRRRAELGGRRRRKLGDGGRRGALHARAPTDYVDRRRQSAGPNLPNIFVGGAA